MDIVWFVVAIAVCVGLAWLGFRIEPHHVSKDGRRFLCAGQKMNAQGDHLGRWRETRVLVGRSGELQIDQKRFMRRHTTYWTPEARSTDAPRGKAVFLLKGHDDQGVSILLALRMPVKSRAVATMDELIEARHAPRTSRSAPRSDPG